MRPVPGAVEVHDEQALPDGRAAVEARHDQRAVPALPLRPGEERRRPTARRSPRPTATPGSSCCPGRAPGRSSASTGRSPGAVVRVPPAVGAVDELVDLVVDVGAVLDRVRVVRPGTEREPLRVAVPAGVPASSPTRCPATGRRSCRCGGSCRRAPSSTAARSPTAPSPVLTNSAPVPGWKRTRQPLWNDECGRPGDDRRPVRERDEGARAESHVEAGDPVVGGGRVADEGPPVVGAVEARADRDAHEPALARGVEAAVELGDRAEGPARLGVAPPGEDHAGVVLGVQRREPARRGRRGPRSCCARSTQSSTVTRPGAPGSAGGNEHAAATPATRSATARRRSVRSGRSEHGDLPRSGGAGGVPPVSAGETAGRL